MCTRLTLKTPGDELGAIFFADVGALEGVDIVNYNIAPTDPVVVLRHAGAATPGAPARALSTMRWGLVPHWAKDVSVGTKMLNARLETVDEKPAYRKPFLERRCAVVADGFYEWRSEGRKKQPFWFHRRDGRPFVVAGLWALWQPPEADAAPLATCTIVTREARGPITEVHDRMPAVLDERHLERWLDPAQRDAATLKGLLEAHAAQVGDEAVFTSRPVSTAVNHVRAEGAQCIEAIVPEEDPGASAASSVQGALFGK